DVRLRVQRDARADAGADRARAPAGAAPGRGQEDRGAALPAAGRQDAGDRPLRRRRLAGRGREGADLGPAPGGRRGQAARRALDRGGHRGAAGSPVRPGGPARGLLRQPDRAVRRGRPGWRHRADRKKDHRGHLRRSGPPRRRRAVGKDPSKVDRSAAYAARHVAKNVVAAGLADRAELQVAYAIGMARPLSLHIDTFGPGRTPRPRTLELVRGTFAPRPAALRDRLDLLRPIYRPTAAYGHFGRTEETFTWERTDVADRLREQAGLTA